MRFRLLSLLLSVVLVCSCTTIRITNGPVKDGFRTETRYATHHRIFFGIGDMDDRYTRHAGRFYLPSSKDLSRICPEGWSELKDFNEWMDILMRIFTFGSYWPTTLEIECYLPESKSSKA